ncbi:MAG: hypothetical protein AAF988_03405, partial [Pseudomonadota bacterium]
LFEKLQKASQYFALQLKRHGIGMKAMLDGESTTSTGRMVQQYMHRTKSAFAAMFGSSDVSTQLLLTSNFNTAQTLQQFTQQARALWNNISTVTASPSAEVVRSQFTQVSAPLAVVQQLANQEITFESHIAEIQAEHDQSGMIGPSADLFRAFENSRITDGLEVKTFDDFGRPVEYAHCAEKVENLTAAFHVEHSKLRQLIQGTSLVTVYGDATGQTVHRWQPQAPVATNQLCPVTP